MTMSRLRPPPLHPRSRPGAVGGAPVLSLKSASELCAAGIVDEGMTPPEMGLWQSLARCGRKGSSMPGHAWAGSENQKRFLSLARRKLT